MSASKIPRIPVVSNICVLLKIILVALVKLLQIADSTLTQSPKDATVVNHRVFPQAMDSKQWTQNSSRLRKYKKLAPSFIMIDKVL